MSRHHFTRKIFHMHNCMPVPIPHKARDAECIPITLHYLYSALTSLLGLRPTIYITHPFSFLSLRNFIRSHILFSPLFHAKFITRRSDKTWCYQHYYYREEEWWSLKSDDTTVRPVRANKSIKNIIKSIMIIKRPQVTRDALSEFIIIVQIHYSSEIYYGPATSLKITA